MGDFKLGYFSHCRKIFNTAEEEIVYQQIERKFNGHVICPNKHFGSNKNDDHYLNTISLINVLFVYEFEGFVSSGVYREIKKAQLLSKEILICRIVKDRVRFYEFLELHYHNSLVFDYNRVGKIVVGEEV